MGPYEPGLAAARTRTYVHSQTLGPQTHSDHRERSRGQYWKLGLILLGAATLGYCAIRNMDNGVRETPDASQPPAHELRLDDAPAPRQIAGIAFNQDITGIMER
jgi:hypothetical protein